MELSRMKLSVRSYPRREDVHVHDYHQLVLPVAGTMEIRIGDTLGAISRRHGIVVLSGARHAFRASEVNRFIVIDTPPTEMPSAASTSPFFELDESLTHLVHHANRELAAGTVSDEAEFHLTALLAGKIKRCFPAPDRSARPIDRALGVMRARYADKLTVTDLARSSGLGASQFHARFRCATGRTPAQALADIRLDRAGDLLRHTGLSIAEIALLVGFSDQSALTRSFRRRRDTTPDAVRRN